MEIIYCPPKRKQFNKTPCWSQVSPLLPFWLICVLRASLGYSRATALKRPLLILFPRWSHGSLPLPLGLCSNLPYLGGLPTAHPLSSLFNFPLLYLYVPLLLGLSSVSLLQIASSVRVKILSVLFPAVSPLFKMSLESRNHTVKFYWRNTFYFSLKFLLSLSLGLLPLTLLLHAS